MDRKKWIEWFSKAREFAQRNAYGLTLGVCLAVIMGTAVYVRWPRGEQPQPAEIGNQSVGAQDENVQRLSDVLETQSPQPSAALATPVPLPTATPSMAYAIASPACVWPVEGDVSRGYNPDSLEYDPTMDAYQTHSGVDIPAEAGEEVKSPMSGTVSALLKDALWGNGIAITHPDGLSSTLYGVSVNAALKEGLAVRAGEAIGKLDASIACEAEQGVHLHWALERDGEGIDPREAVMAQGAIY